MSYQQQNNLKIVTHIGTLLRNKKEHITDTQNNIDKPQVN